MPRFKTGRPASSLLGGRLLLLLVLLFQRRRQDRRGLLVHGLLRLDTVRWERQARDLGGAVWQEKHGGLEMGNLVARAALKDRVRLEQLVLDTLNNTHTRLGLVLERADGERQRWELVVDLAEHVARSLHLQAVVLVHLALEDGRAALRVDRLLAARGVADVDRVHLVGLERHLWRAVLRVDLLRDQLAAVNDEALELVHERTLERLDAVRRLELRERLRHLKVRVARLDETRAELNGVVGALEHISLLARNLWERLFGGRALLRHDGGVGDDGDEAVNVATEVDLDPVAGLDHERLARKRREVADDLIDRHARREREALLHLLALEDGGAALLHDQVAELAELDDVLAGRELREHALERRLGDLGRETVLLDDIRVAQVLDDLLLLSLLNLLLRVAGDRAFVVRWHGGGKRGLRCAGAGKRKCGWRREDRQPMGVNALAQKEFQPPPLDAPHQRHTKVSWMGTTQTPKRSALPVGNVNKRSFWTELWEAECRSDSDKSEGRFCSSDLG